MRYLLPFLAGTLLAGCQSLPAGPEAPAAPDLESTQAPQSIQAPQPAQAPDTVPAAAAALPDAGTGRLPASSPPAASAEPTAEPAATIKTAPVTLDWLKAGRWSDLPGFRADDLREAWPAWLQSCTALQRQSAWRSVCAEARAMEKPDAEQVAGFLKRRFAVYQVLPAEGGEDGLVTGYYEPLLHGSRTPSPTSRYPLRAPPDDLLSIDLAALYPELKGLRLRGRIDGNRVVPYYTRGEIEAGRTPAQGREIAWVDDAVELFFLQVQGSGRIQLDDGGVLRVGYADQNGHPYRSIGRWLVDRGELTLDKASMQGIKAWAREHPERLPELLAANPSYVFFRELPNQDGGPLGALGVPLTPERSIAVDPRAIVLGAPVWLATTRPNSNEPMNRLVMAQDTGSAIRGNVRADYFWGFGDEAGRQAGAMKQKGRMWLLLPRDYPVNGNGRNGL
jgi:membrane-bound lytic murein transglycosylase A